MEEDGKVLGTLNSVFSTFEVCLQPFKFYLKFESGHGGIIL